ncbi:MAG: PLP-dependent aspartate aminotransferase family protein [Steroidobacteraceae bacterium]|jgi:cystathionine beta-lyase/cystathionine gamma-synthase|nr:PLP-dependent aspartate aminotransferase family protein [Steroidobacteraceae bacterium]
MKDRTRAIHPPVVEVPPDNRPLVAPIYQSVKFEFEEIAESLRSLRGERPGFFYQRNSNPTTRQLELTVAGLQGRDDCIVSGSGVAAISTALLSLCKAGDHVLCFVEAYGPTRAIIRGMLARFGVEHTLLSIEDDDGIERVLASRPTRLVVFESPTNPVNKIADIARITAAARGAGALTLLDNTFAGFHNHGQFDVNLFVHSLTKYASGHGDVMGGAIVARRELVEAIRPDAGNLGPVLDPHAAFLIQRGLKTYHLRYAAQSESALAIARRLEAHPRVRKVHYPGLPSHPRHELARAQMKDFGTVVTFDLAGGFEEARAFVESLELFAITASLGSVESLVMPPQFMQPRDFSPEQRRASAITESTVRLSIGAEDTEDLIADLEQALG